MFRWMLTVAGLVVVGFSSPVLADDAEALYEQLFGDLDRRAAGTPETSDDAQLAEQVFKAAENLKDSPDHRAFKALLYAKAFAFGMKDAASRDFADQAINKLLRYDKDRRGEWLRQQVEGYYQLYRRCPSADRPEVGDAAMNVAISAGDRLMNAENFKDATEMYKRALTIATQLRSPRRTEVDALVRAAGQRSLQKRRLDSLLRRFGDKPDDKLVAGQIVEMYVVDFDQPEKALKYAEAAGDDAAVTAITTVRASGSKLTAEAALQAAEWFEAKASSAGKDAQPALQQRALGFYEAFLVKHRSEDVMAMKAKLKVEQLTAAIEGAGDLADGGGSSGHTGAVDLLKLIDVEKHGTSRDWVAQSGKIASVANRYDCELVAPVTVTGSYQVTVHVKMPPLSLDDNDGSLYIMLPFSEKDQSHFHISGDGWNEPRLGVVRQPRRTPAWLQPGRTHRIVCRVDIKGDKVQVQVAVDNKKICTWSGLKQEASQSSYYQVGKPNNPGIRCNYLHMLIMKYEVKPLGSASQINPDAEARPYRHGRDHDDE